MQVQRRGTNTPRKKQKPDVAKPREQIQTSQSPEGFAVNKKGFIEIDGQVLELLPNAMFKIKLTNEHEILAHLSGRMRMHKIRLLPFDTVKVEMSPYDTSKGRITYRY